ncbi:sugar ABC transporter substrate-binding protein [Treponema sp. TIM-1]|uniref:sugar ABC transporter substrate-binding protein n=1 Tax=Treponema sp. TIM-1 TaxID=2898417 RepID=UPI003980D1A4
MEEKQMKKAFCFMFACMIIISHMAYSAGQKGSAASGRLVIGVAHFNGGANNYTTTYTKALQDRRTSKYPDVDVILLDAKGDATVQLDQINDLISQKVDVAIVWPVSSTGIITGLEALKDAGIPVIITNSGVDASGKGLYTAFSGPSDYKQGYQAGEAMIKALGGKGKVVELAGTAGYDTAIQRSAGFAAAIKGTGVEILESQPTDWSTDKSQTIMETYITKYGTGINGIYCADDGIAKGAMNALDAVGKNNGSIPITSCTLFASGYDAIKEGKQFASVLQSPKLDAELALDLAVKVGKGEKIPDDNRIETFIVSKDNVNEFERPTW